MIKVVCKFYNGIVTRMDMKSFKDVKKAMLSGQDRYFDYWLKSKISYVERGFLVTGLKLNKKGKVAYIEFTEQRERGFNG